MLMGGVHPMGSRKRALVVGIFCAIAVFGGQLGIAVGAMNADVGSRCEAATLQASARYLAMILSCHSDAARDGRSPASSCVRTAIDRFHRAYRLVRRRPACAALGDETEKIESLVGIRYESLFERVHSAPASKCNADLLDAVAQFGSGIISRTAHYWTNPDLSQFGAAVRRRRGAFTESMIALSAREGCGADVDAAVGATEQAIANILEVGARCTEVSGDVFRALAVGPWQANLDHAALSGYSTVGNAHVCPPEFLHGERLLYAYASLSAKDSPSGESLDIVVSGLPQIQATLIRRAEGKSAVFGPTGGVAISDSALEVVDATGVAQPNAARIGAARKAEAQCEAITPTLWQCIVNKCNENIIRCLATVGGLTGCLAAHSNPVTTLASATGCGFGIGLLLDDALSSPLCATDLSCTPTGFGKTKTVGCATKGKCDLATGLCIPIPTKPDGTDCTKASYGDTLPECTTFLGKEERAVRAVCCGGYCCKEAEPCAEGEICVGPAGHAECVDCSAPDESQSRDMAARAGGSCPIPTPTATATPDASPSASSTPTETPSATPTPSAGKVRFVYYNPGVNNPGRPLGPQPPQNVPFDLEPFKFQEAYDSIRWDIVFDQVDTTAQIDLTATGIEDTPCPGCNWPSFGSSISTYIEKGTNVRDIEWEAKLSGNLSSRSYRGLLSLECALWFISAPNTIKLGSGGSTSLTLSGNSGPFTAGSGWSLPDTPGVEYDNVSPYPDCLSAYVRVSQAGDHLELHYTIKVILDDAQVP